MLEYRFVNARLPTGRNGAIEKKSGTLRINDRAIKFQSRALGGSTDFVVPRGRISSVTVSKHRLVGADLTVHMIDGRTASFRLTLKAAKQAAAVLNQPPPPQYPHGGYPTQGH